MGVHEQVLVSRFGEDFEVDAGIVEMLTVLWDSGVVTDFSCQGVVGGNEGYVAFASLDSLLTALAVLDLVDRVVFYRSLSVSPYRDREYPVLQSEQVLASGGVFVEVFPNQDGVRYVFRASAELMSQLNEQCVSHRQVKVRSRDSSRSRLFG